MQFYIINTDWEARTDIITCDLWFEQNMAFTGDSKDKWKHANLLRKLKKGDILFMYHSKRDKRRHKKKGFVGVGQVREEWDKKCYEMNHRILYRKEPYEYRIPVRWCVDWRNLPKDPGEIGLFTTSSTWARIDENKYPIHSLMEELSCPC